MHNFLFLPTDMHDDSYFFCIYLQDVDEEFVGQFLYLSNLSASFDLVLLIMLYKKKLKKTMH